MVVTDIELPRLVVDEEPIHIRFESEIMVVVSAMGYAAAAFVIKTKTKKRYYILLGAKSLCQQLEVVRRSNNGSLLGVEVWIRKDGPDKTAKYIVE